LQSAESIPKWIDFIREAGKKDIKIYVIGNKSDLDAEISAETRKMAEELS
jgi:GTPase SAR1 family protein